MYFSFGGDVTDVEWSLTQLSQQQHGRQSLTFSVNTDRHYLGPLLQVLQTETTQTMRFHKSAI